MAWTGLPSLGRSFYIASAIAASAAATPAVAAPVADIKMPRIQLLDEKAPQPIGFKAMCNDPARAYICDSFNDKSDVSPLKLTRELIEEIAAINVDINARIKPRSDQDIYGVEERWTMPEKEGDCEDFVLLKRMTLHKKAKIPLANLPVAVVRKADGEGHAVLVLRTTGGDFILDNLNWSILPWKETPYEYLKMSHAGKWLRFVDRNNIFTRPLDKSNSDRQISASKEEDAPSKKTVIAFPRSAPANLPAEGPVPTAADRSENVPVPVAAPANLPTIGPVPSAADRSEDIPVAATTLASAQLRLAA